MKKLFFILSFLFSASLYEGVGAYNNVINVSIDNEESYVCSVVGWNSANGEKTSLNIYFVRWKYGSPSYIAREVDSNGNVSSLHGTVKIVTNPDYSSHYRYYVKTGIVGAYFFNTNRRLDERYIK